MVLNRKVTGRASSVPAGLVAGVLCELVLTLIISVVSAYLVSAEFVSQDKIGYCAIAVLIMSSIVGTTVTIKRIKKMPIQMAAINGLLFYGLLLAMTALFFGGQYDGMGITLLVVALGSGVGGIMASRKSNRRKQKYYKI